MHANKNIKKRRIYTHLYHINHFTLHLTKYHSIIEGTKNHHEDISTVLTKNIVAQQVTNTAHKKLQKSSPPESHTPCR